MGGSGLVLSWSRLGRIRGEEGGTEEGRGPGQKTSNFSPCPVPLVIKLNGNVGAVWRQMPM